MTHVQENTTVARRAYALRDVRSFFDSRNYLEVDPPGMLSYSSIDAHIDPIETTCGKFLHTSPEYAMKRLLSEGHREIYFLGHVFRKEEISPIHREEFTMVEWYTEKSEKDFLQEVEDFFSLFISTETISYISYDEIWNLYGKSLSSIEKPWTLSTKRDYIWSTYIEPNLGQQGLQVIYNFPPECAILSKVVEENGKKVAKRFEWYYQGIELGNGFWELCDLEEHKNRFSQENTLRIQENKKPLICDPQFLEALNQGFSTNTYGIACGFDRLFMLKERKKSIVTKFL